VAGIAGADLLRRSVVLIADAGFAPTSVDVTVVAERPAIAPSRDAMRLSLAGVLQLPISAVSVKATRPEGLGLEGDGIGCLAIAVVV
jgi:2-C-methyl-D-erythritol 2,4-cyclodiphosphate synthase